jgi:pyruvate dehydrogenase E1 component alpha subunit
MPLKTIGSFEVKYLQILNEAGGGDESLMPNLSQERLKALFESILLVRAYNERALSLQREGRLGTYASVLGLEASQVGSALALSKDDWVFPSFRESGVLISMGFPIELLFRYWHGDERGMKTPEGLNIFPMSVPVGTQIPHAVGAAIAMRLKKRRSASIVFFGDGGSSRGDFHEALNMAGVFNAPVVFSCQNNQWAISMPRKNQTRARTIAQRAESYGFEGIQVDGNDVLAVYKATADALDKAREGGGPTLIESFTYRLDDHTTSDDASRYRDASEVSEWRGKEPLIRYRTFLEKKGLWTQGYEDEVQKKAYDVVDKAIKDAEAFKDPDPTDILTYSNHTLTQRQKRELKELGWQR